MESSTPDTDGEHETHVEPSGFGALGLSGPLLHALERLGYEEPTPIQLAAIPAIMGGQDVLGQAATGTGKTAAFALPILERLACDGEKSAPQAMVLTPTRELAVQVSEAIHTYGRELGARVAPLFGGQPIDRQIKALRRGCDVVVATPGRAIDHLQRGTLDTSRIAVIVLDEADEMLDMGFADELDEILSALPVSRQTVLLSATMPPRLDRIVGTHLRDPQRIEIEQTGAVDDSAQIRQVAYLVPRAYKQAALGRILDAEAPSSAIVFCRTRTEVDQLSEHLNSRGYRAEPLHGGLSQEQRDRVMQRVRTGVAELLIATDVAARGLDIDLLSHVVNFDVPSAPESYVHRIGRVGRAGRTGVALTLVEPRERRLIGNIQHVSGSKIPFHKLPSLSDVRARRLDNTQSAIRALLDEDDLDEYRTVVAELAEQYDPIDLAAAAIRHAHEVGGVVTDESDIPEVKPGKDKSTPRGGSDRPGFRSKPQGGRDGFRDRDRDRDRAPEAGMTRLFINAGREAGLRPGDVVGAIAGESGLSGRDIGSINITRAFTLVDVPDKEAERVIRSLSGAAIRGRNIKVRRDQGFRAGK